MSTKNSLKLASFLAISTLVFGFALGGVSYALASATSQFAQTINAGTLSVDIVDGSYAPVTSPSINMSAVATSFSCQNSTGTFGSSTQQIYVKNLGAANNGWTLSLAASSTTAYWHSASANSDFDFNDPTTSGCADGADADSLKGQLTVDPSVSTLANGACTVNCATTNVSKGSSAGFNEGTVDSITLLSAAAGSSDIGDWTLRGVSVGQKIPAEQAAASDYSISLTLSVIAL
jgi:hypothetical protein